MNAGKGMEKLETLCNVGGNFCKMVQFLWNTGGQFLNKLNIELPYDLHIRSKHTQKIWKQLTKKIFTCMFIAALFKIAKNREQL